MSADEAPVDPLRDADTFWNAVSANRSDVARALYARYPLVPRSYVARHFLRFSRLNRGNPRAILYLDAELGAPARGVALLDALESVGVKIAGSRCLDIGCANGGLLLAAAARGARHLVGVEISPQRLRSALKLTKGKDIGILPLDIAHAVTPEGIGTFDVIFCIDVLEHVSSAIATSRAMKRLLDTGTRAVIFLSVFNPRSPGNVAAEPHYGVPGMILLPRQEAVDLWGDVRNAFGSTLDYEVADWTPHGPLVEMLRQAGLSSSPFVDSRPILDRSRPFWAGFHDRIRDLETRVTAGIRGLTARPALRQLLLEHLRRYCDRYLQDHEAVSSAARARDEHLIALFMDYYTHTIQLVLRHAAQDPG